MPTYYQNDVVNQVQALLETPPSVQPIGSTWHKIMNTLKSNKIVKEKRIIPCKYVLPHNKNRSGMMINGFNCRANASKVMKVGANMEELHGAVCIEMSPFEVSAKQQMAANVKLAKHSKGLLPLPTGEEQFLSLGTGHMCAFVRCATAGLKACFTNIAGSDGMISVDILNKDPQFKVMIEQGWAWEVLPWQVEATWPALPDFAQRALNSSNAVATDATEWEVAVAMGEWFNTMEEPSWNLAEEAASAGDPQCVPYISKIRTLVEKYGGGGEFPLIREQEDFYKTLGANKRLGEAFCKAIIDIKLDDFSPRLHVRHALITLNLTSEKMEDGVVRFVLRNHIASLASRENKPMTIKADEELKAGRDFLLELASKNRISGEQFTELLGLFRVRYAGFMTKLSKLTFEGVEYKTSIEIVARLLAETSEAIKSHDTPGEAVQIPLILRPATKHELKPTKSINTKSTDNQRALTIEEASSHEEAAKDKGFRAGGMAQMKKSEPNRLRGIFQIQSIKEYVCLQEIDAFKDVSLIVAKITFAEFMKTWSPFKGDVPLQVDGAWSLPCNLSSADIEAMKAKLFIDLRQLALDNEHPPLHELILPQFKPQCLRALKDLPKGEIVFYPTVTSISQISTKPSDGNTAVMTNLMDANDQKVVLYVGAPPQPKAASVSNWKEGEAISPMKWLIEEESDEQVNIIRKEHKTKDFVIPFWESKRAVKRFEKLIVKKSTKRKAGEL